MSKKKNDPFDMIMKTGAVSIGTMGVTGVTHRIGHTLPSPQSHKIMNATKPLALMPTLSATGGVFGQLRNLEKKVKK